MTFSGTYIYTHTYIHESTHGYAFKNPFYKNSTYASENFTKEKILAIFIVSFLTQLSNKFQLMIICCVL